MAANLTIDLTVNTKNVDKATKKIDKNFKKINKSGKNIFGGIKDSLKDLGGPIGDASSKMGDFTGKAMKLGKAGGPIAIAIVAIGAAFVGLVTGVLAAEKAERKFLNTFDKIDKRALIQSKVLQQSTGESEDALNKAAKTLTSVYAISISDAFALIKQGVDKGANSTGEFLSSLEQYPTHFKAIGLTVKEAIALTTEFATKGTIKDWGSDAVKEFGIKIRGMNKATKEGLAGIGINHKKLTADIESGSITQFDAMQLISNQLLKFPEESKEAQEGFEATFGTKGEDVGREFLHTIVDANLELSSMPDRISEIQKAQEGLTSQWELFKQNIFATNGVISDLSANMFTSLTGSLKKINMFFEFNFATKMKAVWNKTIEFLAKGIFLMINPILDLLKLIPAFKDSKIIKGIEGVTKGEFGKFDISKEAGVAGEKVTRKTDLTTLFGELEKKKLEEEKKKLEEEKKKLEEEERKRKEEERKRLARQRWLNKQRQDKGDKAKGEAAGTRITGGQTKAITLNIDNIVGEMTITQNQDPLEIKKMVTRALITAVVDASQFS